MMPLLRRSHPSLLSSPTDKDAFVVRTPVVSLPAEPPATLHDTAVSVATVSTASSIEPMSSLRSVHDTQPPIETRAAPQVVQVAFPPSSRKATPERSASKVRDQRSPGGNNTSGTWDRSRAPPVTVILPSPLSADGSAQSTPSPVRPATSFTSPVIADPTPAPPPVPQPTHAEVRAMPASTPVSTIASTPLQSTPRNKAASTTRAVNTALFCTPYKTPATSAAGATAVRDDVGADVTNDTRGTTALITTALLSDSVDPPLPPHDRSVATSSRPEKAWRRLDTRQAAYDAQRSAIADAAAAEQQRLLTRLQQHCNVLEKEKRELLTARLEGLRALESASRLRALRAAQEDAAADEIDSVRARLGHHRDAMLDCWLRVVHAHSDAHYAMPQPLLRELEDEGERLSLSCLASVAGYHTQKARLQAVRQQRMLKEAEVARLRWEAHVRRCAAEERRGALRVVARVRPPMRRAWLPAAVLSSPEARDFDRGFAVRVPPPPPSSPSSAPTCVEVSDPTRDLRRRYAFAAAYDGGGDHDVAMQQQRLFKEQLQPLLEHMCRTGQRVAVLAFGAVGSGKTYTLVGPPVEPPPRAASRRANGGLAKANAAGGGAAGRRRSTSTLAFSDDDDDDDGSYQNELPSPHATAAAGGGLPQLQGVSEVRGRERCGITRCLDPATEATQARVLRSMHAAEEEARRQRSSERHDREERRWRMQAGVVLEDGLLPRAVAWLTAHLRESTSENAAGGPVVESVVFSMYEVYNDHIYDLLPVLPLQPAASSSPASAHDGEDAEDDGDGGRRRVRSDPSTWPRWNAGWLPAPHIKNSNPAKLTELQVELVQPSHGGSGAEPAVANAQPQWRVRASEVEVRSAADVLQAVELGMLRRRSAATQRSAQSSRSHLFLRFRVEVQRPAAPEKASAAAAKTVTSAAGPPSGEKDGAASGGARPKGYPFLCAALVPSTESSSPTTAVPAAAVVAPAPAPTCVTELLFTDFAGSERVELSNATGDALREAQYINTSLSAVADVLAAVARANPAREATSEKGTDKKGTEAAKPAAELVERWGGVVSRPGVSLTRSAPVFLQPRFSQLVAGGGGRFRVPSASKGSDGEAGLPLRRRVLSLMDSYVAGPEAAQWWRSWRASSAYVPFRTCKTTQLLQSALGAPCKTLVLACVRPCSVAEVVLPASMQDRKGKQARELALALFDRQAPPMLAEVHSTLTFADRLTTAARGAEDGR